MDNVQIDQGRNSAVKLVKYKGKPAIEKKNHDLNYTMNLEARILKCLKKLSSPHFPKLYKYTRNRYNDESIIIEYIEGSTLYSLELKGYEAQSAIVRSLLAAAIMNEQLGIVHNDLHTNNIMIRNSSVDVDVYIFPDADTYVIPTYCIEPVLIDFGLAFCGSCCTKMETPITFNNLGYFSFLSDNVGDVKRVLRNNNAELPKKFKQNIDKITSKLPLDTDGYYESYMLPDVYTEIIEMIKSTVNAFSPTDFNLTNMLCVRDPYDQDENDSLINIFTSQLPLPLGQPSVKHRHNDIPQAWVNFVYAFLNVSSNCMAFRNDTERTQFLMDILELNVVDVKKLYAKNRYINTKNFSELKVACDRLINALHWHVYTAKLQSENFLKNTIYPNYTSVRQIVKAINTDYDFMYECGDVIRYYTVATAKSNKITITEKEANLLNNKTITVIDLMNRRGVSKFFK